RTVMQTFVSYKPVTKLVTKCEDRGHYECREVPCSEGFLARHKRRHQCRKASCCEPCCPPPTKGVQVWVPCKVTGQVPVTCMERVCETRAVPCKVTVLHREMRTEAVKCTVWECVPTVEAVKCTVMEVQRVPYKASRVIQECVPQEEKVTCVRMVSRV